MEDKIMTDMENIELQVLMEEVCEASKAFVYNHGYDVGDVKATEVLKLAILLGIKKELGLIASSLESLDSRL